MPTLPTSIPAQLAAGDSATWSRSFDDYRAGDGWSLKYTLVSPGAAKSFAAAAQPDGTFLVTLATADTTAWPVDRYSLTEYVERSGERVTLRSQPFAVTFNLAGATVGVDTRSHARKTLEVIDAYLEKGIRPRLAIIDGRRLETFTPAELLVIRDRYRAEVNREDRLASDAPAPRILARL